MGMFLYKVQGNLVEMLSMVSLDYPQSDIVDKGVISWGDLGPADELIQKVSGIANY